MNVPEKTGWSRRERDRHQFLIPFDAGVWRISLPLPGTNWGSPPPARESAVRINPLRLTGETDISRHTGIPMEDLHTPL